MYKTTELYYNLFVYLKSFKELFLSYFLLESDYKGKAIIFNCQIFQKFFLKNLFSVKTELLSSNTEECYFFSAFPSRKRCKGTDFFVFSKHVAKHFLEKFQINL